MNTTIGIIIDIAIVAIVLIFGLIGMKKGFLKTVLSFFSWSVCLAIAIFTAKYAASLLNKIYDFTGLISKYISNSLVKTNAFFNQAINTYETLGKDVLIQESQNIEMNGALKKLIKLIFNRSNLDMSSTNTIGSVVGYNLGNICFIVITGIVIFILLKIVLFLLSKLFKKIQQVRVIGGLNKFFGLLIGLIKASLIIIIANCILVGVSLIPAIDNKVSPIIQNETYIEKFIYNQTDNILENHVFKNDNVKKIIL